MLDTIRARRDEIYSLARRHRAEKLWVFGSCARKEETPDSDVDFLVQFAPMRSFGDQVELMDDLASCFGRKVDVVSADGLRPYISKYVWNEAVPV